MVPCSSHAFVNFEACREKGWGFHHHHSFHLHHVCFLLPQQVDTYSQDRQTCSVHVVKILYLLHGRFLYASNHLMSATANYLWSTSRQSWAWRFRWHVHAIRLLSPWAEWRCWAWRMTPVTRISPLWSSTMNPVFPEEWLKRMQSLEGFLLCSFHAGNLHPG